MQSRLIPNILLLTPPRRATQRYPAAISRGFQRRPAGMVCRGRSWERCCKLLNGLNHDLELNGSNLARFLYNTFKWRVHLQLGG